MSFHYSKLFWLMLLFEYFQYLSLVFQSFTCLDYLVGRIVSFALIMSLYKIFFVRFSTLQSYTKTMTLLIRHVLLLLLLLLLLIIIIIIIIIIICRCICSSCSCSSILTLSESHTCFYWWFFTVVWEKIILIRSPGLF